MRYIYICMHVCTYDTATHCNTIDTHTHNLDCVHSSSIACVVSHALHPLTASHAHCNTHQLQHKHFATHTPCNTHTPYNTHRDIIASRDAEVHQLEHTLGLQKALLEQSILEIRKLKERLGEGVADHESQVGTGAVHLVKMQRLAAPLAGDYGEKSQTSPRSPRVNLCV